MTWTAGRIGSALVRQTFQRRFLLVCPECYWTGYEADLLGVTNDLRLIDVEIKVSRGDLKADAAKDKWWTHGVGQFDREARRWVTPQATPRDWPPKVWKHYYVGPATIFADEAVAALPARSGILALHDGAAGLVVRCVRRSQPNRDAGRITAQQAVDIARLASLRMWDVLGAVKEKEPA